MNKHRLTHVCLRFTILLILGLTSHVTIAQITLPDQSFLFTPQQAIRLKLRIEHTTTQPLEAQLLGELSMYGSTHAININQPVQLSATQPVDCLFSIPAQAQGLYILNLKLVAGQTTIVEKSLDLGVLPQAQAQSTDPSSAFGAVAHLNRMNQTQLQSTVQNMARIGIRWAREGFIWSDIQPSPVSNMRWEHYDQLVETCRQYGISVLPVLAYGTKWAAQQPPSDINSPDQRSEALPRMEAWEVFVKAAVKRYKDRIHHWEIWNEPNSTTFLKIEDRTQQADAYAKLLATAHGAIESADPDAMVIIGGFTPKHWIPKTPYLHEANFMKAIYTREPRPFDILGYHPYTAPHTETTNEQTVSKYFRLAGFCWDICMQQENKRPVTWMTEMGTPTMPFMTKDRAADYMAVLYVAALADGRVAKNFWYDFQNDGTKADNKEHNFGLLNHDGSPKPGYFAYLNLTSLLDGAKFETSDIKSDATMHMFSKNGRKIKVFWANGAQQVKVNLPVDQTCCSVLNVIGQTLPVQVNDNTLQLDVTQSPLFVIQ